MAGGKMSPRQKMINLMYLVFIAMLAMNMTGTDGQTADINESIVQELIFELRKKIA